MTRYRISQLAGRVGLRPTTLRFYEQAGLLLAQRSASGYRLYGEDAVERVGFILSGKPWPTAEGDPRAAGGLGGRVVR